MKFVNMVNRLFFPILVLSSFVFRLSSYADTPRVVPTVVDSIPHEQNHFTQGLFFDGKDLIESTGHYGESGIYRRTLDGKILDSLRLAERYFGEGSVAVGDDIFYLTWKSRKAFIVNRKPFAMKGEFRIPTEGWGLTYWRDALLMSNGSSELLQIGLGGFSVVGAIAVRDNGREVPQLNELEVVRDTLYANIWTAGLIAVVELPSGRVLKYLDFTEKAMEINRRFPKADVLNGIAFDGRDFWITGKNWPWIYRVRF